MVLFDKNELLITRFAHHWKVCTNGIVSFNRDHCPFAPGSFGSEINSQWPILAPFYADLTLKTPENGIPPFLGISTVIQGTQTNNIVSRADADVIKLIGSDSSYETLMVIVATWYYALAFGSQEVWKFDNLYKTLMVVHNPFFPSFKTFYVNLYINSQVLKSARVCVCVLDFIHFSLDIRFKVQWNSFSFFMFGYFFF